MAVGWRKKREPAVLIACSADWGAPGRLPAVFTRAGCRVDVICPDASALYHTRHVTQRHPASSDIDEFSSALLSLAHSGRYDSIIAVDDPLLEVLAASPADVLRPWFPVDPDSEGFEVLLGKVGFCRAAQRWGLPVPRTAIAHSLDDAERAAREIGYPVVLKRDISFAGLGVRLADDPDKLATAYSVAESARPCVVQEMIDGPIGNTAALFVHGRPVAWMTAYKTRTWPGDFGPSCARRFVDRPEVAAVLATIGERTGYHGFLALDWVERSPVAPGVPGELAFIELNARPVPAIQMAPLVGVDFAAAIPGLFGGCVTVQVPKVPARVAKRVVPMFPQDFFRAIAKRDEAQLEAWGSGAEPFEDIPWDDPELIAWYTRTRSARRHFERVFSSRPNTRAAIRDVRAASPTPTP